jgi:hypothetical protein
MWISSFINAKQFIIGSGTLILGSAVYAVGRPIGSTSLGDKILSRIEFVSDKTIDLGFLGGIIPELVHPFCFALVTIALFPKATRAARVAICLIWLAIEFFFEVGQFLGKCIISDLSNINIDCIIIEPLLRYFRCGTYDHFDMLAICLGITMAYIISELTKDTTGLQHSKRRF